MEKRARNINWTKRIKMFKRLCIYFVTLFTLGCAQTQKTPVIIRPTNKPPPWSLLRKCETPLERNINTPQETVDELFNYAFLFWKCASNMDAIIEYYLEKDEKDEKD